MLLVKQNIKPEEIVKIIHSSHSSIDKKINYDFSDESDEELDNKETSLINKLENNIHSKLIKSENSDTESDSGMKMISYQIEKENEIGNNTLNTLEKVKKFIDKNNQILNKTKKELNNLNSNNIKVESSSPTKLNIPTMSNNINLSSSNNKDKDYLNKKRRTDRGGNDNSLDN
jgi:hypothetical protein